MTFREFMIQKLDSDIGLIKTETYFSIHYTHRTGIEICEIPKPPNTHYERKLRSAIYDFAKWYKDADRTWYESLVNMIVKSEMEAQK